jgi:glutamyl-Q tRNA(Asp) synthetase
METLRPQRTERARRTAPPSRRAAGHHVATLPSPTPAVIARRYRGRFAPSPTGPLHAGSLVAALASWLDARAHEGTWLVRIEDLDPPREQPGAAQQILDTLADFGLESDEPVVFQSARDDHYRRALARLQSAGYVYACDCSRSRIAQDSVRFGLPPGVYPGTCRERGLADGAGRALRVRVPDTPVEFVDRACGRYAQRLAHAVGDFVIRRADHCWAYQLAVVVDDGEQGITDVVRGADLLDNTPRQLWLQRQLGLPAPRYLHVPVVVGADGRKLSKQNGAAALDRRDVLAELRRAARHLGLPERGARTPAALLRAAIDDWRSRWVGPPTIAAEELPRG